MNQARVPVVSFGSSCESPPVEFTVPTSPAPHACDCYDSAQSEEISSKPPDAIDGTMDWLLDSYLCRCKIYMAHHTVSNILPRDQLDEASPEHCDGSLPEPYGAAVDFPGCLYDSYLDEDMTWKRPLVDPA